MKQSVILTLILLLLNLPGTAERKKVAVVLGGGGAKGVSHIGVLKVLEEAGIPIDYVVGTSMGAIVGGFYSIGYNAAEIDSMVREQNWPILLSDKIRRHNQTFPEKENSERYLFSLPVGKNKKDKMTGGVIKGQNIQKLFSNLSIGFHDSVDFNRFPIPFACVALDLVSGRDHVFHSGSLPLAMRASMAIPAVFTPVRLDSMVLVDGGVINNYPANVAREMGADVIIGVDLGTSDLKLVDGINTPGDVVGQIIALYGYEKYSHNREITDLLLRPDMKPYNSASFNAAAIDTLINRGEQEARQRWDEILSLKEKIYENTGAELKKEETGNLPVKPEQSFSIGKIHFEGIDPRDEKWLLSLSRLKENSEISLVQLEKAISILMGTNSYSHVSYNLVGGEPYTLYLILQEKSDSSLNLGLRYDTEENISLLLNATFDYRAKARSHFSLTGRLGKSSYGRFDYALERSPLRNINIAYMFRYQDMDIYRRGEKTYNTTYQHHFAELAFTDMTWLNFKVKAGVRYEYFNYNSFLYKEDYHDFTVKPEGFISYFGSAHLETLDSRYFPNRGVSLEAHYSMYTDNFVGYNGKSPFSAIQLGFTSAIRLRSHLTLLPSVYGRVLIGGNLAYPYLNAVGGEVPQKYLPQQIPFVGINHVEIFNNSVGVARLQIRQRLWSRNYITVTGNYGIHHDDFLEILKGKHIWGAGLGYAYNSLGGPLSVTLSISDWSKNVLFYLNLGYTF